MNREGNFYGTHSDVTISEWDDLEPFIRSTIKFSWTELKHPIQLMYREAISLDRSNMPRPECMARPLNP